MYVYFSGYHNITNTQGHVYFYRKLTLKSQQNVHDIYIYICIYKHIYISCTFSSWEFKVMFRPITRRIFELILFEPDLLNCSPSHCFGKKDRISASFFFRFHDEYSITFNRRPGIMYLFIEFIDSTGLNYIMFAHNSVVLRN